MPKVLTSFVTDYPAIARTTRIEVSHYREMGHAGALMQTAGGCHFFLINAGVPEQASVR